MAHAAKAEHAIAATRWFALRRFEFLLALAVVVAIWHFVSIVTANKTLVPSPLLVIEAWGGLLRDDLPADVLASLTHLAIGYLLGVATGLALAILSARFVAVETIVNPLVKGLRTISWLT